jgi:hypothetical protein
MKIFSSKDDLPTKDSAFIKEGDIFSDLEGDKGSSLFLGKYSFNEVAAVMKKRNFYREAQKRNLWPLVYRMDSSEYPLQRFQIFFQEEKSENLIVDLKIREGLFHPQEKLTLRPPIQHFKFLIIEWLTLQNPLLGFSGEKSPLPGQKHPGLNLGKKVLDIFVYLARISHLDGLLAFPAYFHNALLFSRQFQFINPVKQAEIVAIQKSFRDVAFKHLAWIVYLECMRDQDGNIYKWEAEEQVFSLNKTLKNYLQSEAYQKEYKKNLKKFRFTIDWDCYRKKQDVQTQVT